MPAPKGASEKEYKHLKESLARRPGVRNKYALATWIMGRKRGAKK